MGRKIPGKKHRTVKDPLVQRAIREHKLKDIINAPPVDPNDQEIPNSLKNIIRLKQIAKDSKFIKKRKKPKSKLIDTSKFTGKEPDLPGMKKPVKHIPGLVQWHGETDENFLKRVDEATQAVIDEVEFEHRFGTRVKRNAQGEVEGVELAEVDEIDYLLQNKRKLEKEKKRNQKMKKKSNKGDGEDQVIMNSKERRKLKRLTKKQERHLEREEKTTLVDKVRFGEVIHRPPQITVRPRSAGVVKKPGVKGNLLLEKMFNNNNNNSANKKNKYPNMSMVARHRLEEERNNAVELYRQIKAQRRKQSEQQS